MGSSLSSSDDGDSSEGCLCSRKVETRPPALAGGAIHYASSSRVAGPTSYNYNYDVAATTTAASIRANAAEKNTSNSSQFKYVLTPASARAPAAPARAPSSPGGFSKSAALASALGGGSKSSFPDPPTTKVQAAARAGAHGAHVKNKMKEEAKAPRSEKKVSDDGEYYEYECTRACGDRTRALNPISCTLLTSRALDPFCVYR